MNNSTTYPTKKDFIQGAFAYAGLWVLMLTITYTVGGSL